MSPSIWFRQFLDGCVPSEARRNKPWLGWLLLVSVILFLLFILFTLGLLFYVVDSLARFGSGTLGGKATFTPGGVDDFSRGVGIARIWALGLFSTVPLCLLRLWWIFGRAERPRGLPRHLDAAKRGEAKAGHRVAQHYRDRDPAAARVWLLKAAHGGSPQAMVDLAREYQEGRGGPRDLPSARVWLQKALAAGAPEAQGLLEQVEAQLADRYSEQGR